MTNHGSAPDDHDAASVYDRYWSEGVGGWHPEAGLSAPMRALLEEQCRGRRVLDFGGGDGHRYGAVVRGCASAYVVADVSRDVLSRRAAMGDGTVHVDDLASLDPDFDVVLALEVVEHLLDPVGTLTAVTALLRPGGTAVVSVPNAFSWWNRARMLAGRLPASGVGPPGVKGHTYDAPHIRFFDLRSIERLLTSVGLQPDKVLSDGVDTGRFRLPGRERLWPVTATSAILAVNFVVIGTKPR